MIKAVRSNLARVFMSKLFYVSVLGVCIVNIFNLLDELQISWGTSVFYYYIFRHGLGGISILVTVFSVTTFALSYDEERKSGYFKSLYLRQSRLTFAWAKLIAVAASTFLTFILGYMLLLCILSFIAPLFPELSADEFEMRYIGRTYFVFLAEKGSVFFYLLQIIHEAVSAAFLSAATLVVSLFIRNRYLLICFPIIMIKIWETLAGILKLPDFLKWTRFYHSSLLQVSGSEWINYSATIGYFMILIILLGIIFASGIRNEAECV